MASQGPIVAVEKNFEAIEAAISADDARKLLSVFDGCELNFDLSDEISAFFLRYSDEDTEYNIEALYDLKKRINVPVIDREGQLSWSFQSILPERAVAQIAVLLKLEMERCIHHVFDCKGKLLPWFTEYLEKENMQRLVRQFGEVETAYYLFKSFFNLYCKRFDFKQDYADEICSQALVILMKFRFDEIAPLFVELFTLERHISTLDKSFKALREAKDIYAQARQFVCTAPFEDTVIKREGLQKIYGALVSPLNGDKVSQLRHVAPRLRYHNSSTLWQQVLGAVSVFLGSFIARRACSVFKVF